MSEVALCSYGVNYVWPTGDCLVFGVVLDSYPASSQARTKVARNNRRLLVGPEALDRAVKAYRQDHGAFQESLAEARAKIVDEYKTSRQFERDFLGGLREDLQRSLSVLHDYRQFLAQVRQNLNVILEARYPGRQLEDQLAKALPAEKAIYWACRLMGEKLETAFLLLHPERLTEPEAVGRFRLHGAVYKYLQIYAPSFDERGVKLNVRGESTGQVRGNIAAFGVIPHTFIDNALKYAPRGSEVIVAFTETNAEISLSVISQGPKIDRDEQGKIFDLFYRGRHAAKQEEIGAGFGLYLAQLVAIAMGTRITVMQSEEGSKRLGYRTEFGIRFERDA